MAGLLPEPAELLLGDPTLLPLALRLLLRVLNAQLRIQCEFDELGVTGLRELFAVHRLYLPNRVSSAKGDSVQKEAKGLLGEFLRR